jgi:predicted enzyme related to lactoylglutathione lyase
MAEHGMFHWNELMTRDVETAKKFYAKTIGWTFDGMPMEQGTYWLANIGGRPVAGIFDMTGHQGMEDIPENWFAYLAVDDIDKRVGMAKDAGATIVRDPFDIPGVGRIAILKEPGGAAIGWMTPAPMPE